MKLKKDFAILLIIALFLTSCLTCEKKEYSFKINKDKSGTLTIKYINILSHHDSDELSAEEQTLEDYEELVNNYIEGSALKDEYPDAEIIKSDLYEENGKLCATVIYKFENLNQIKLFKHNKKSPYMFQLDGFSGETFLLANGEQGPDYFPVIMWAKNLKELNLTTKLQELDDKTTSLLKLWKESNE